MDFNLCKLPVLQQLVGYLYDNFLLTFAVPVQLILCAVDIYGTSTIWPKPSLLKVIQSKDNESCTAVCARHEMVITK